MTSKIILVVFIRLEFYYFIEPEVIHLFLSYLKCFIPRSAKTFCSIVPVTRFSILTFVKIKLLFLSVVGSFDLDCYLCIHSNLKQSFEAQED